MGKCSVRFATGCKAPGEWGNLGHHLGCVVLAAGGRGAEHDEGESAVVSIRLGARLQPQRPQPGAR